MRDVFLAGPRFAHDEDRIVEVRAPADQLLHAPQARRAPLQGVTEARLPIDADEVPVLRIVAARGQLADGRRIALHVVVLGELGERGLDQVDPESHFLAEVFLAKSDLRIVAGKLAEKSGPWMGLQPQVAANGLGVAPGVEEDRLADAGECIALFIEITPPAVP
jgi:hypothetical protein